VPADNRVAAIFEGKPAFLSVTTEPVAQGRVGVIELDPPEGRKALETGGFLGESIMLSFDGDPDMVKNLQITIDATGRTPRNVTRLIHAGERTPVKISLDE
jgi:hypothetical protein